VLNSRFLSSTYELHTSLVMKNFFAHALLVMRCTISSGANS
jgi:hypothetical protein